MHHHAKIFLSYKAHYNFSRSYERAKLIQTKFFVLHVILYCFGVKLNIVRQCFIYLSEFYTLSRRHAWRFYTPIAANLIASENRKRFSPPIDAKTPGDFFRRSRRCGSFENSCDKKAQPDGLALLAIRSNKRRKSRERAHLANLIADI